jgi:hypothetical protein
MPVLVNSPLKRLERYYYYHYGHQANCVLAGSMQRQNELTKWYDYSQDGNDGTITGATWSQLDSGIWVLTFDGADDNVNCASGTSVDNIWDGGGTAVAWISAASDGENDAGYIVNKSQWLLRVEGEAASKVKIRFTCVFSGDDGIWDTTATEVALNTWTMVSATYNSGATGNNPTVYINTTAKTVGGGLDETQAPTGASTIIPDIYMEYNL